MKELKNIEIHIKRGCLSNIPPGCGTTRNERLHRELKKVSVKKQNKISIDLAKARTEKILYYENRNKDLFLPSVEELMVDEQKTGIRIMPKNSTKFNKSSNKKRIEQLTTPFISDLQSEIIMMISSHVELSNQSNSDAESYADVKHLSSRLEILNILNEGLQRFKLTVILNGKLRQKAFNFRKLPVFRSPEHPKNDEQIFFIQRLY